MCADTEGTEVAKATERSTKLQTRKVVGLGKREVNSHHVKSNFRGVLVPNAVS